VIISQQIQYILPEHKYVVDKICFLVYIAES